MFVTMMIFLILCFIMLMSIAGTLMDIKKILIAMAEAKVQEMKLFGAQEKNNPRGR